MITQLNIQNFRSIQDAEIPLGKMTVLTGANNSGKSSVLYALMVLKNLFTNPNRNIDELLTLPFINLGGLENVLNREDKEAEVKVEVEISSDGYEKVVYAFFLGRRGSKVKLLLPKIDLDLLMDISFPYTLNKIKYINLDDTVFQWNGMNFSNTKDSSKPPQTEKLSKQSLLLKKLAQLPQVNLSCTDIIPTRRGFTKPIYGRVPISFGYLFTEDEIATALLVEKGYSNKVSKYFKKITDLDFEIQREGNSSIFQLQVNAKDKSWSNNIVNEGSGVNQILFLLAKILYPANDFICVDEPEIHLHPSLINKFVDVLFEIIEKENKRLILSTHSEHFINAILRNVANDKVQPEDVKAYYLQNKNGETTFEHQSINEKGQISGGLKSFYEEELKSVSDIFKITDS